MTYVSKLRHRKKALENFGKFISQERHIIILICRACCLYFTLLFKCQLTLKYNFYENRYYGLWHVGRLRVKKPYCKDCLKDLIYKFYPIQLLGKQFLIRVPSRK